ncbi:MAG: hypothetical protein ABGZ23_26680, partial [Fuerstiella sp.]
IDWKPLKYTETACWTNSEPSPPLYSQRFQPRIRRLQDCRKDTLRSGNRVATFIETVKAAAIELSGPLPRQDDDADELPNHLICIHPRI